MNFELAIIRVIFILFFKFCDVAKLVIMHKEDLAKIGYKPNGKIKTCKNPLYIFHLVIVVSLSLY